MIDDNLKKLFIIGLITCMSVLLIISLLFLSSCQYIPEIAKDVEEIANDEALMIRCDKECLQKQTDLEINVKLTNKDK